MGLIGTNTRISDKPHWVSLANPGGPVVPDPEGGFVEGMVALDPPQVFAGIRPATARDLERNTSGTAVSTASHIINMDFHPQVTTQTRITFNGRTLLVTGVANPEERNVDLILVAEEVVA